MTATTEPGHAEPGTGSPIVDISGLDVGYLRHRKVRTVVLGLNLSIRAGEVVAVVGESGSGKTTVANAIIGLLPENGRITAGSVLVGGVETVGAKEKALRALRGSVVGLVPQDPMVGLNPTLRIGTQVAEALRLRGLRDDELHQGVLAELGQAGIPEPELRAQQYPHELSGGLRQRVLIAIALAGRPEVHRRRRADQRPRRDRPEADSRPARSAWSGRPAPRCCIITHDLGGGRRPGRPGGRPAGRPGRRAGRPGDDPGRAAGGSTPGG